jgi:hypothetical protein
MIDEQEAQRALELWYGVFEESREEAIEAEADEIRRIAESKKWVVEKIADDLEIESEVIDG